MDFQVTDQVLKSGLKGAHLNNPEPKGVRVFHGFNFSRQGVSIWQFGVDVDGEDWVAQYTPDESFPFNVSGDMDRTSLNRRRIFGPAIGSPKDERATFTFACNPDTDCAVQVRPWRPEIRQIDAYSAAKGSDADRSWFHCGQGKTEYDWRVGMTGQHPNYNLGFYCGNGEATDPKNPGTLAAELTPDGTLIVSGSIAFRKGGKILKFTPVEIDGVLHLRAENL